MEEDDFIERSLDMNFPDWDKSDEVYPKNKKSQVLKDAFESGNMYAFFKNPISACREFETMRFHKLQEEYAGDTNIENLEIIESFLYEIAYEEDNRFSEEEMIMMIWNALHASHPRGIILEFGDE
jgi:hypothetical protein